MISEFSVILENYSFLECPRWREGRLWVSDFFMHQVVSCRRDGSDVRIEAQAPGRPAGLGWLPDGRLLVVSMEDHKILRREADGSIAVHADLSAYATGLLNDMIVDPEGRAFVGNFGFDSDGGAPVKTADLMRVDPDGAITLAASGMHFPNGCVLLGDTLVVAETAGNRLSAFAVQAEGSLGPRRDWARFGDVPTSTDFMEVIGRLVMAPDGICADCEGAIWIADALGNRGYGKAGKSPTSWMPGPEYMPAPSAAMTATPSICARLHRSRSRSAATNARRGCLPSRSRSRLEALSPRRPPDASTVERQMASPRQDCRHSDVAGPLYRKCATGG